MATFQRARSDEQREMRRQAILETATAMLQEMGVAELSLNELSRRVGLAKSNVLRYFDSREAVLLELLDGAIVEWVDALGQAVPAGVSKRAGEMKRAEQLASVFATSLIERPVLCDLLATQVAVLERNVSVDAIVAHKLAGLCHADALTALVQGALPELDDDAAWKYMSGVWLTTSALWAHARPPQALVDAFNNDERLQRAYLEFPDALEDNLTTLGAGLLARA